MPSSGMQYVHRKLQRSVTEMRRSRTTRPNGSTRSTRGHDPHDTGSAQPLTASARPPRCRPAGRRRRARRPGRRRAPSPRAGGCPAPTPVARGSGRRRRTRPVTRMKWTLPSGRRARSRVGHADQARAGEAAVAHHPAQRRPGQQLEADQRAHRVAGQPEDRRAGERAEGERLGRLDRDLHPRSSRRCGRAPP